MNFPVIPKIDKKYPLGAAVLLVVFGLGFGAARCSTPVKIVEKEKIVEKLVVDTSHHEQDDTHKDQETKTDTKEHKHVKTVTHVEIKPDGTKTVDTTVVVDTGTKKEENNTKHQDDQKVVQDNTHKVDDTVTEKSKETTYAKPQWRVTGLVGLNLNSFLHPLHLGTPGTVYGAEIQRHLFWNVSAGVWGLSSGQGGVVASLEF